MESLPHWLLYAGGFLGINLAVLPGLFLLVTILSRRVARVQIPARQVFIDYAYALIPLGLAAWIAFSIGFVFVNGSYALVVISDPFGWGWNLFGTAGAAWRPLLTNAIGFLQIGVLTAGLWFAVQTAYRISRQHNPLRQRAFAATLPLAGFMAAIVFVFTRLYIG
jgi:hypothetical protein